MTPAKWYDRWLLALILFGISLVVGTLELTLSHGHIP